MEGSPALTTRSSTPGSPRHAACLACRRSKVRCHQDPDDRKCRRCQSSNRECTVPDFHVGRQKGIKNKRSGLDKAVHRIEQAIERSHANGGMLEDERAALHLQELLSKTGSFLSRGDTSADVMTGVQPQVQSTSPHSQGRLSSFSRDAVGSFIRGRAASTQIGGDDGYALEDAENPLQLLARASDLPIPPRNIIAAPDHVSPVAAPIQAGQRADPNEIQDLRTFFGPLSPNLDIGEDIDPIDMGYITPSETDVLFNFFYKNLSHTRWGLDPLVHTVSFVRARSAFLFTSILAASALFLPSTAALSKRLSVHRKNLAYRIMVKRNRSPEIVLAFMVNIPWMSPGEHWADDETCAYLAMALTIAMDISLNKLIIPSRGVSRNGGLENIARSDCISAKKALALDGFDDVEPSSSWGQRLLRRRERIWLALFVLDRGVCLARGRPFTVPMSPLIEICDQWHISDIVETWDESIVSSAVLRRDLVDLISNIKITCDEAIEGSHVVQSLKDMIENFFHRWFVTWAFPAEGGKENNLPPYVEILVSHTRLSTYSSVINHPTAPPEVKRFFHAAGLSSALNVMRAAVQGEGRLKSMPNNTTIMISFAACFALRLSILVARNNLSLAPSIKILIDETADVLERIGTIPNHRKGMSALFGRHLREVVRNTAGIQLSSSRAGQQTGGGGGSCGSDGSIIPATTQNSPAGTGTSTTSFSNIAGRDGNNTTTTSATGNPQSRISPPHNHLLSFEPLLFSAMSDEQIVEAIINHAGDELQMLPLPNFFETVDDKGVGGGGGGLDWLDWFSGDLGA